MSRIVYDFEGGPANGPVSGSLLRSTKTGNWWRVVTARQVRSRVHAARFALVVDRTEPPEEACGAFTLTWKRRRSPTPRFRGGRA